MRHIVRWAVRNKRTFFIFLIALIAIFLERLPHVSVRLLPQIADPVFTVMMEEEMQSEDQIAQIITALSAHEGVERVTFIQDNSTNYFEITSTWGHDMDNLQFLLQERLNDIMTKMGTADIPIITKRNRHVLPIAELHLRAGLDTSLTEDDIETILSKFQVIAGVGRVVVEGRGSDFYLFSIRDEKRMALGLAQDEMETWIHLWNAKDISISDRGTQEWFFHFQGMEIDEVLTQSIRPGIPVGKAFDVRKVVDYPRGERVVEGEHIIIIKIFQAPGSSSFDVFSKIQAELPKMPGISITLSRTPVSYLRHNLKSLLQSLLVASLVLSVILFLFGRSLIQCISVSLVLLLSLIITVLVLHVCAVPIDLLMLGAMVIGVGLAIDNPIITLEELQHGYRDGGWCIVRTSNALKRITGPLLVANLSTSSALLPILFQGRFSAALFGGMFAVITLMLGVSLLGSFVLLPCVLHAYPQTISSGAKGRCSWGRLHNVIFGFVQRRPAEILLIASFLLCGGIWLSGMVGETWMPSSSSRYWKIAGDSEFIVGAEQPPEIAEIVNVYGSGAPFREVTFTQPVKEIQVKGDATPLGNPYALLFPGLEKTLRWYAPVANSPLRPFWDRLAQRLVPGIYMMEDQNVLSSDYLKVLPFNQSSIKIRINQSFDRLARASRIEGRMVGGGGDVRQDETGRFKRLSLDTRSVDSLINLGGHLVYDHRETAQWNRSQFMQALLVMVIILFVGLTLYFRSVICSVVVLCTIPLSISGSILFLYLFRSSFNVISIAAMIITLGISINDAVLKVGTINTLVRKNGDFNKALSIACRNRLRPVVLTSLTTLATCLVLRLLDSKNLEIQDAMTEVMMGGLIFSTLSALFVIPALLLLLRKLSYGTTHGLVIRVFGRLIVK